MPTGLVVGRVATIIANILRGKHKPSFTPHVDCGDHVVVVNADKVRFTGRKLTEEDLLQAHRLCRRLEGSHRRQGARGPLPRARAREGRRAHDPARPARPRPDARLHLYNGTEHPHGGQNPEPLDVAAMNRKNKVGA
jgi:large subunit ribosomal protein L13